MLCDSSRSGRGSIEDVYKSSTSHIIESTDDSSKGGEWMNYGSHIVRWYICPSLDSYTNLHKYETY